MHYYLNKHPQLNGDHEVHSEDCPYLPDYEDRIELGNFWDCEDAMKVARKKAKPVNGCFYCAHECYKG